MIILVDMDDTIEDLLEAWCQFLNHKHGTKVHPSEVTDWNVAKFFPDLTKDEVYSPLLEESFWLTVRPRSDAMKYLQLLCDDGDEVYVVTDTNPKTIKPKFEYIIKRYFPCIPWDHMIITAHKQLINGDVLIDDGVHNLEGGKYAKILMSAPHNLSYDAEANDMTRVSTWEEAYLIIQGMKEEQAQKMEIVKRNGEKMEFCKANITRSISLANEEVMAVSEEDAITKDLISTIANRLYERCRKRTKDTSAAEVQEMVETELMKEHAYEVAKVYIRNSYKKELEHEMEAKSEKKGEPNVILYSTNCPRCKALKHKLATKGITYSEVNSIDDMLAKGIKQAPMLEVDGELLDFTEALRRINSI